MKTKRCILNSSRKFFWIHFYLHRPEVFRHDFVVQGRQSTVQLMVEGDKNQLHPWLQANRWTLQFQQFLNVWHGEILYTEGLWFSPLVAIPIILHQTVPWNDPCSLPKYRLPLWYHPIWEHLSVCIFVDYVLQWKYLLCVEYSWRLEGQESKSLCRLHVEKLLSLLHMVHILKSFSPRNSTDNEMEYLWIWNHLKQMVWLHFG